MSEPIKLADWIAALRGELAKAVEWQLKREQEAADAGVPMLVPPFRLEELKLEVELTSSQETVGKTEAGVKAEGKTPIISFFVVSGEAKGSLEHHRGSQSTQRVTLVLKPGARVDRRTQEEDPGPFMGAADEPSLLGGATARGPKSAASQGPSKKASRRRGRGAD